MANHEKSKLYVEIEPSQYIDYNEDKLYYSVWYYIYNKLNNDNLNYLPHIDITIRDDDDSEQHKFCGSFCSWVRNEVFIVIYPNKIMELSNTGRFINSPLTSLFYTFLHEFYLMSALIESHLTDDGIADIDKVANKLHRERFSEFIKLQDQGFTPTQAYLQLPINQEAAWYAFQNLPLFENLYEAADNLYIPDDALVPGNIKKYEIVNFDAMR